MNIVSSLVVTNVIVLLSHGPNTLAPLQVEKVERPTQRVQNVASASR